MDVIELIRSNAKSKDFTSLYNRFIDQPENLDQLIAVATSELKHPFPEYASWLVLHISKNKPTILQPFQKKIIDRILTSRNQSVLRNLVYSNNLIGRCNYREGELLNYLIGAVKDEDNKVALQVYSLYSLISFINDYPEIKLEVDELISLKQAPLKPAFKVAIRNFQQAFKQI